MAGDKVVYNFNGVKVILGNIANQVRFLLSPEGALHPVWGVYYEALASPMPTWKTEDVLRGFYAEVEKMATKVNPHTDCEEYVRLIEEGWLPVDEFMPGKPSDFTAK